MGWKFFRFAAEEREESERDNGILTLVGHVACSFGLVELTSVCSFLFRLSPSETTSEFRNEISIVVSFPQYSLAIKWTVRALGLRKHTYLFIFRRCWGRVIVTKPENVIFRNKISLGLIIFCPLRWTKVHQRFCFAFSFVGFIF